MIQLVSRLGRYSPPACLLLVVAIGPPASAAEIDESTYRNRQLGLEINVPEGWRLSRHTGYPSLLALLSWGDPDADVWLSVGKLRQPRQLAAFVADNNRGLEQSALRVTNSRAVTLFDVPSWEVTATTTDGKLELHQTYLAWHQLVLIWTLRFRAAARKQALAELHRLFENIKLSPPGQ